MELIQIKIKSDVKLGWLCVATYSILILSIVALLYFWAGA